MPKHIVSLDDKYALDQSRQLLTGTQAIVRLMLTQRARDVKAGLNTAGYVTGYRGSPIASLEAAMLRAKGILEPNHIKFMAGLSEDSTAAHAPVAGRIDRVQLKVPEGFTMPPAGRNIRHGDQALDKEARLHDYKRGAILAFARANKLDRIVTSGGPAPKIGIITCG